jgi:hypothetical protein
MLRSRSEPLKRFIGGSRGVDESLATKREGVKLVGEGFKHSSLKAATMAMKT